MDRQYSIYENSAAFSGFDEEPPKKGGGAFFRVVVILLLIILIALVGLLIFEKRNEPPQELTKGTPLPAATASLAPESPASTPVPVPEEGRAMPNLDGVAPEVLYDDNNPIPAIFDAASKGVVGIINYVEMGLGEKKMLTIYGVGTGFLVSNDGYVLTNAHVIENAAVVTVKKADGEELDASIIGLDLETDVAVLKIDAKGLTPLAIGDSDAVRVGEYALAIGNPLDSDRLANTLTFGIISAKAREITLDNYTNTYLQTDAAINFGNSGGPLLNMKGEVIGINSAKTVTAGYDAFGNPLSAEGIGFALPINKVLSIMETLVTKGKVTRPGIGVTITTITETIAESENLPVGALVENVVNNGPAHKAGLRAGDIIVEANGQTIKEQTELVKLVEACRIYDELHVRVYRAGDGQKAQKGEYFDFTIVVENKTDMNFDDVG